MLVSLSKPKLAVVDAFPSLSTPTRSPRKVLPAPLAAIFEESDESSAPSQPAAPKHSPRYRVKPTWVLDTIIDEE